MNLVLAVVLLAAAGSVQGATIAETLALCRAKGSSERLACYDELARAVAAGVSLPSLPSAGIGKWIVDQRVDPMDDTQDLFAMLLSEDYVSDRKGAALGIVCRGGVFDVQFLPQGVRVAYPTDKDESENFSMVQWRFDSQEAVSGKWWVHEDREVLYPLDPLSLVDALAVVAARRAWPPDAQVQWAKDVLEHSKLFVRIQDSEGRVGTGDFHFDLRGASRAVEPVRRACGW